MGIAAASACGRADTSPPRAAAPADQPGQRTVPATTVDNLRDRVVEWSKARNFPLTSTPIISKPIGESHFAVEILFRDTFLTVFQPKDRDGRRLVVLRRETPNPDHAVALTQLPLTRVRGLRGLLRREVAALGVDFQEIQAPLQECVLTREVEITADLNEARFIDALTRVKQAHDLFPGLVGLLFMRSPD